MAIAVRSTAQPVKGHLAVRRLTVRRTAATLGINEIVLGRILNGHEKASPRIRTGLAALLGIPEHELFDEAAR